MFLPKIGEYIRVADIKIWGGKGFLLSTFLKKIRKDT